MHGQDSCGGENGVAEEVGGSAQGEGVAVDSGEVIDAQCGRDTDVVPGGFVCAEGFEVPVAEEGPVQEDV